MLGLGTKLFSRLPKRAGGIMILSLMGFNIGQFAYPLVEAAWGAEALALLVMFDIGNALMIFSIGFTLAGIWSGQPADPKAIFRRLVTFVPLISYVLALGLNMAGLNLPALLDGPLKTLGAANQPLVLLLVGLYLDPIVIFRRLRQVLSIVFIRYGLGLAVGLALYYFLPAPQIVRSVLLVTFLLPVPMSVIPYSLEYGLDADLAGALVNATIIISFGLLWLAFLLL
jgi:predicted permease